MAEYAETREFRGASFRQVDLGGARFRDSDLSGVRIASCLVDDLRISGFDGRAGTVVVDDVDVSEYVRSELDRRYPERVRFRAAATAGDYRATWTLLEGLWADTIARARLLPEDARQERVEGEWSFVETLRHLVFAVDTWVQRMLLGSDEPFHPLGLPPTDCPPGEAAGIGLDVAATPSFDEVVAVWSASAARVGEALAAVTDGELDQVRTAVVTQAWGEMSETVAHCLRVVLNEHLEHRRFAARDLAVLETR